MQDLEERVRDLWQGRQIVYQEGGGGVVARSRWVAEVACLAGDVVFG
ncbi:MAG: hypothetical protein ACOWWM_05765 [Desulfobacterales bacterium]